MHVLWMTPLNKGHRIFKCWDLLVVCPPL